LVLYAFLHVFFLTAVSLPQGKFLMCFGCCELVVNASAVDLWSLNVVVSGFKSSHRDATLLFSAVTQPYRPLTVASWQVYEEALRPRGKSY